MAFGAGVGATSPIGIVEDGHPGQGVVDQRFDALGIRVKVEMMGVDLFGVSGNPARPAIDLYFTRSNQITFHFLPLIKK